MWFEIEGIEHPGVAQLQQFLAGVRGFLRAVVTSQEFAFLWEGRAALRELARVTLEEDVAAGAGLELDAALREAGEGRSASERASHGLSGRPLHFKLAVVVSVDGTWDRLRGQGWIRMFVRQLADAIDALLDSLADVFKAGGIIKEFKDAVAALA